MNLFASPCLSSPSTSRAPWAGATPRSPARSSAVTQGQSKRVSSVRFSERLSDDGARRGSPGRKRRGRRARRGRGSDGAPPFPLTTESASPRVSTPEREGSRQMRSPGPALTALRSRARKAGRGAPRSSRRACRSRTSSGRSRRRAAGSGPSNSRRIRFEKAVRSERSPCRATPRMRPPERRRAASSGEARYQRRPVGHSRPTTAPASR